ncbi:MAG TPA: serine/threonine-protein kinase, partial [Kofleriaceae bacterium]|nr:serine/threonine-protein kinase [Kofleriaceae bacterium]
VVQVLDFGRLAGTLFIAMELVDGLDLAALLRRYRELGQLIPVPAAFQMAVEIARGLDFAHQHGVVHRDVSPSNILISRAGEVKIADFGIAQAAGDRRAIAADRRRIMGKWRYMSPEQARGEPLSTRSDLFSAAVVWFELFTGEKLFPGDEADVIIDHICHMPIPRASERRAGLPPRLDDVLRHALERDPKARPEKAADVLRALVEISYESSIVATALDVSGAVKEALEASARLADGSMPPKVLDQLIREQLLPADEARLTAVGKAPAGVEVDSESAVEGSNGTRPDATAQAAAALAGDASAGDASTGITLIRRGIDPDGVTHWELDAEDPDRQTMAAVPSALRTGKRSTGSPPVAVSLEDEEDYDLSPRRGRRVALAGLALAAVAGAGVLAWQLGGTGEAGPPGMAGAKPGERVAEQTATGDAVRPAMLVIDSSPRGARVVLDGRPLPDPTPTSAEIAPDIAHRVELEREGFHRWQDERVSATPGENVRIVPTLVAQRSSLTVTTRPPGAEVLLDGEKLGETPLHRDNLRPGHGRQLVLRKPDYKPIAVSVDLVDQGRLEIERRMESAILYGRIKIHIRESWADVSLSGRGVGRAPGILRLPVGQHRLRLFNPFSKRERTVSVEVLAGEVKQYEFEL